ncbi:hypothetical protein J2805_003436 [Arthrobacter oryzae]|nr:hypothetical protein [Arthrobacter oryzae]
MLQHENFWQCAGKSTKECDARERAVRLAMLVLVTAFVLALWFVTTLIAALPLKKPLRPASALLAPIIPSWSFFAPEPGVIDFHILVRDVSPNGHVTPWHEVCSHKNRVWYDFVWNPGQRQRKALFDVSQELTAIASSSAFRESPNTIELTVPYLTILNYVSELGRTPFASRRQFVIVSTSRRNPDPAVLFVSGLHSIDGVSLVLWDQ